MTRTSCAAIATLTILTSWGAGAQEASPIKEEVNSYRPSIMRADRNHDSLISADEYLADAGRRFGRLDENGDGTVEKAEVDRAAERIAKRIRAGMERALSRNDADGDGKVTRAESDAAASKRFASLDEDADGSLRPADFRRRREPAKQVEAETSRAN